MRRDLAPSAAERLDSGIGQSAFVLDPYMILGYQRDRTRQESIIQQLCHLRSYIYGDKEDAENNMHLSS